MKAARWYGKRDVRIEDVPEPAIVNPHDAIVRVTLTSICGSDLHHYHGLVPGLRPGDILGHEFTGEIVDVGPAVRDLARGQRVIVMCGISCGRCWFCHRQLWSACDNTNPAANARALELAYGHGGAALFGSSQLFGGYAGAQAELVRVPFADVGCFRLPDGVSDEQAVLLGDLVPTAWMAAESCELHRDDTVAVFGCGPVGQMAIRAAFHLGASRVIAIDAVTERLAMAEASGAIALDDRDWDVVEQLDELTGGRGPDACIDAVGLDALRTAILVCRKGGTVSIAGVYGGAVDRFPIGAAFGKGLTLRMGQTHFHRYARPLLERAARGFDPSFVITHRVRLDDLPDAYAMFDDQRDGCIKVVARCGA